MTQEEPKEDKAFDSVEQISKIEQDLVRRKTEQKPLKWCSQCGHKCPLPPQRKPLTDEQIMANDVLRYHFALNGGDGPISKQGRKVIDAIEAAHGIKENT